MNKYKLFCVFSSYHIYLTKSIQIFKYSNALGLTAVIYHDVTFKACSLCYSNPEPEFYRLSLEVQIITWLLPCYIQILTSSSLEVSEQPN